MPGTSRVGADGAPDTALVDTRLQEQPRRGDNRDVIYRIG